jgi:vitamin B12 transporter
MKEEMRIARWVVPALLWTAGFPWCAAAAEPVRTEPVVVTATRIPQKVSEVAASVGVVERDEIEAVDKPLVGDSLQHIPGVEVTRKGSEGGQENIRIRGGSARGTLVLIDGFPVNSPTLGEFDIGSLPADAFERVEVMRGAQSALYGSNAMSGVVNFIPRKGGEGAKGGAGIHGGSFNSLKWNGYGQGGSGGIGYHLGASGFRSDGLANNDDGASISFLAAGERPVGERNRLHGILLTSDRDKGIAYDGTPGTDVNHRQKRRSVLGGLRLESVLPAGVTLTAYGSRFDERFLEKDPADPGETSPWGAVYEYDEDTKTRKQTAGLNARWTAGSASDTFLGVEFGKDRWSDKTVSNFGNSDMSASTINRSAYLQQEIRFGKSGGVSAGVRADQNSRAGTQFSPRAAGFLHAPSIGTRFRVGVGRGFRVPSIMDKHPVFGNPDLSQETTVSHEVGADVTLFRGNALFSGTWFHQSFKGLIQTGPASMAHPFGRLENIGHAFARGVETAATVQMTSRAEAMLGYTLTDSWDSGNQVRVQGIPRHRGTASVTVRPFKCWEGRIEWRAESDMLDFSPADFAPAPRPGYARVDGSTRYRLFAKEAGIREISIRGRIGNLLNRQYEERKGYPAPGINFLLGAEVSI